MSNNKALPFGLERQHGLFAGRDVYFSGAIRGDLPDPFLGFELVSFMIQGGANVLSAHVVARSREEMHETFYLMSGKGKGPGGSSTMNPKTSYQVDMAWVDAASHVVAVVDGPSHGVGMEIMRALLKPSRGLDVTPVLCLASVSRIHHVSWMISGATHEFGNTIRLVEYSSLKHAKRLVQQFLLDEGW